MQAFLGEGVYRFDSTDDRNSWAGYYFPKLRPEEQGRHPGRFQYQGWVVKFFTDGLSVKVMRQKA